MLGVNFGLRLEQVRKTLSKKLNTSDQPLRDIVVELLLFLNVCITDDCLDRTNIKDMDDSDNYAEKGWDTTN